MRTKRPIIPNQIQTLERLKGNLTHVQAAAVVGSNVSNWSEYAAGNVGFPRPEQLKDFEALAIKMFPHYRTNLRKI